MFQSQHDSRRWGGNPLGNQRTKISDRLSVSDYESMAIAYPVIYGSDS
ncbi:hypothetical protein ACN4EW_19100 [Arthrospira platensis CENA650]